MGGSSSKQDEETKKKVEALKLKYFDKRHGAALSKVQKTDVQLEFFEKVEKDENELKVILVEASKVLGKYADKAQEQEGNIAKMENAFLFFVSWHLAQKLANNDKWNATTKTSELQAIALYAFKQLDSIAKNTQKKLSKKFEAEISKGQELGKEIELYENFLNSAKGISLVQMLCAAFKAKGPMRHKPLHAKFTQNYDKTLAFMNFHYMDDNINGNQLFEAAQKFYGYICKKTYPLQQMKEYTDVDMPDYIFPYLLGMWPIFPQAEYEVRNPETGAKEKTPGDIEDLLRYHLEALDKYHVDDEESTSVAPVSKSSSSIRQAPLTLGTATDWLAENAADLTQDDCADVLDALMKSPSLQGPDGRHFWARVLDQALSSLSDVFDPQKPAGTPQRELSKLVDNFQEFELKLLRAGLQTSFKIPTLSAVQGAALVDLAWFLDNLNQLTRQKEEEARATLTKINEKYKNRAPSNTVKQQKADLRSAQKALSEYLRDFGHSTDSMRKLAQEALQGRLIEVQVNEPAAATKQPFFRPKKQIKDQR